ncbi:hypothetical protein [Streptomyces sp. NPDC048496]|uniref:hypothetical protein n=1 Tax=Streptomyces sp. NPDC048496 TaxID=3365558 RepID=UPI003715F0E9
MPLRGEGRHLRDWLHMSGHCRGIKIVLRGGRGGEVHPTSGGTELANKEFTGMLLDACAQAGAWSSTWRTAKTTTLRHSLSNTRLQGRDHRAPA